MRILVMGATGVIGRRVVPLLLAEGHEVTAVGRSTDRLAQLARIGATTATLDLFDRGAVTRAVGGHAVVVNLATHIPGPGMRAFLPGAWAETDRIRRDGSAILADAVLLSGAERFIQESFALIYPDSGARWVDETVQPCPAKYNRSSMDAEASAGRVTASGHIGIALRFALFYGAAEDGYTRDVLRYARRGWLPLFGNPDGYVPTVTHDDAARAVAAALGAPAGVYNVVDDEPLTRRALARALGEILSVPAPKLPPKWMASLAGSLGETLGRSVRLSNHALRTATAWSPTCRSVREGWRAAAKAITVADDESARRAGGA
jgi:nucleoside-diphosphate-sugar epimerase